MNSDEIRASLEDPSHFEERAFKTLGEIARLLAVAGDTDDGDARHEARDLVIRSLPRRQELGSARSIQDALLARAGLYPYIDDASNLGLGDRLALEAHRPMVSFRRDFVFHNVQAQVYARLMDGDNVILTAPTSFGKTLIVDALLASRRYRNVAIVVPTLALIDEVRRRLSNLNRDLALGFKIVTHPSQKATSRSIFVFTQERVLEQRQFPRLDLVVVDEMYKLDLDQDADRSPLLNQALYRLLKISRQVYMLGPSVGSIGELPSTFSHRVIPSDDSTVAVDVIEVERFGDERSDLIGLCAELSEPTLIFVKSPKRASDVVGWLVEAGLEAPGLPEAAEWTAANYDPQWTLTKSLRVGVALHHGRLPRSLAHYLVTAFNNDQIRFLVCTSTLIEGVNTAAKNIIVLDDRINRKKYDLFTFKNIQGRSGRMFRHFVGRVYLFNPPPDDSLPEVDIPALTQSPDAPPSLLLNMDPADLPAASKNRIAQYTSQTLLPVSILRANSGVDLDSQLDLAEHLAEDPHGSARTLAWNGFPKYAELLSTVEVLYRFFPSAARRWGAFTAKQLTRLVWRSYNGASSRQLVREQLDYARSNGRTVDDVVNDVLTFHRSGLTFGFPKYLRAVDLIQASVFGGAGAPVGDYSQFAAAAEGAFLPAPLSSLDEYGLPLEVATKLRPQLLPPGRSDDLDAVLARLSGLDRHSLNLTPFEKDLLEEAQSGL